MAAYDLSKAPEAFTYWYADDIAETVDGVSDSLYEALWAAVGDAQRYPGEIDEAQCIPALWERFDQGTRYDLHRLADDIKKGPDDDLYFPKGELD